MSTGDPPTSTTPGRGPRFELAITVNPADIDELGHVNNVVYVRWMQDVALAHWTALAAPEHRARIAWVAVRHEIDYKSPAVLGDRIVAATWIGTIEPHRCERFTEIRRADDGRPLARSRTIWCPVDRATGRLVRVGTDVQDLFR